ncbi:hypothetical protein P9112_008018 [Eukaryota sp. TZLM1-RC]
MSWIPLESNPSVLTSFAQRLGLPSQYQFEDIFGLDDELLAMVPQPVKAAIFLFPITDKIEQYNKEEEEQLSTVAPNNDLFFAIQDIPNACGTYAIIHAVLNNSDIVEQLPAESWFAKFLSETTDKSPHERAVYLNEDQTLAKFHQESGESGQTTPPSQEQLKNEPVYLHFITFVNVNGRMYEFDGRKSRPVPHGETTEESFLKDVAKIAKEFIERTNSLELSMVSLSRQ